MQCICKKQIDYIKAYLLLKSHPSYDPTLQKKQASTPRIACFRLELFRSSLKSVPNSLIHRT